MCRAANLMSFACSFFFAQAKIGTNKTANVVQSEYCVEQTTNRESRCLTPFAVRRVYVRRRKFSATHAGHAIFCTWAKIMCSPVVSLFALCTITSFRNLCQTIGIRKFNIFVSNCGQSFYISLFGARSQSWIARFNTFCMRITVSGVRARWDQFRIFRSASRCRIRLLTRAGAAAHVKMFFPISLAPNIHTNHNHNRRRHNAHRNEMQVKCIDFSFYSKSAALLLFAFRIVFHSFKFEWMPNQMHQRISRIARIFVSIQMVFLKQ